MPPSMTLRSPSGTTLSPGDQRCRQHSSPDLVAAVESGQVSVSVAADVATLPKDEQTEIVARGETGCSGDPCFRSAYLDSLRKAGSVNAITSLSLFGRDNAAANVPTQPLRAGLASQAAASGTSSAEDSPVTCCSEAVSTAPELDAAETTQLRSNQGVYLTRKNLADPDFFARHL